MRLRSLIAAYALFATYAVGDGASVLAQGASGPWRVMLFAADQPLHAGKVDLKILVQDARTGEVARDVDVAMEIEGDRIMFGRGDRGNRILYGATVVVKASNETPVTISIRRAGEQAVLHCSLRVVAAKNSSAGYLLCFAVVPAGLLLGWRVMKRRPAELFRRTG